MIIYTAQGLKPLNTACSKYLGSQCSYQNIQRGHTWLDLAHKKLDAAIFAAYGWKSDLSDEHPSGTLRGDFGEVTVAEPGEEQRRKTDRLKYIICLSF